jgi:DNA-binding XRE family transcriptional regulator
MRIVASSDTQVKPAFAWGAAMGRRLKQIDRSTLGGRIGWNIRMARLKRFPTQEEFGLELGVTRAAVGSWERGECMPTIETLYDIAKACKTTASKLLPNRA